MSMFKKAKKEQTRLRMALVGPSGSGKTYTALTMAVPLGKRIALIDTERGSASKYSSDVADFDVCELESFSPRAYIEAIEAAGSTGYDVLIIDSLSHAWSGQDGALEMVDKVARKPGQNSFTAWGDVTPLQHRMIDAILRYPGHVLVTMRTKTEYVLEVNERGKQVPRKVGLAPVQRAGIEYEFDVVADMDHEHRMIVSKSRCQSLADAVIDRPGRDVAATLLAWLDDGADPLADVLAELDRVTDAATLAKAKESARRVFRVVTNGRREKLAAAVAAAEARVAPRPAEAIAPEADAVANHVQRVTAQPAAAPAQLAQCKTVDDLRAWIADRWPEVLANNGPGAAERVIAHARKIGANPGDVDRWLGNATQSDAAAE